MSTHPKHAEVTDKVAQVSTHLSNHYLSAEELVAVINDKVPKERKLGIQKMDKAASVKQNTAKLVTFIQNIKNFVEEIDKNLKEQLSPEKYAKVASVTATIEQVLDIVKTVGKGLVIVVGPLVSTIARKLKTSKLLHKLEEKLGIVHGSKVVDAIHKSQKSKGTIDASHPDIHNNIHELDHAIKMLKPDEDNPSEDFASAVSQLVEFSEWHDDTFKSEY